MPIPEDTLLPLPSHLSPPSLSASPLFSSNPLLIRETKAASVLLSLSRKLPVMLLKPSLVALLAVQVFGAVAQDTAPESAVPPTLNAQVTASFPDAELIGLRLVNGKPTRAVIEVTNNEAAPITVAFVSGALSSGKPLPADAPDYKSIVHNMTASQYNLEVGAGETTSVPYAFALDLQPQDVQVQLMAIVTDAKGGLFQIPRVQRIFLYLVLTAAFAGTLYFVYKTWIEALFPQAKRSPRTPKKAKKAVSDTDTALSGSESTATATGKYDEAWIPDHHISRPNAGKRSKSGTPKAK